MIFEVGALLACGASLISTLVRRSARAEAESHRRVLREAAGRYDKSVEQVGRGGLIDAQPPLRTTWGT